MKYDLHIHSKYSLDCMLEPREIIKIAMKIGLNGIAITDHNTIKGGREAKKYAGKNFIVIIGSEIRTERGEVIGLFLEKEIKSRIFIDVVSEIRDQNGIIVIPHPFDGMRHSSFFPSDEDLKFIDCIEGFNSRCIFQKYNKMAIKFAKKYGLPITAGSDAHFANEIGNAYIVTERDDIREAILKNDIKIFGRKTLFINHIGTVMLKLWRKVVGYGSSYCLEL